MSNEMLDVATRDYLDGFKKEIIELLNKMEANIDRVVTLTIENLKEDIRTLKQQSLEHYAEEKEINKILSEYQTKIGILEDDKSAKKFNVGTVISVISILIAAVAVIVVIL